MTKIDLSKYTQAAKAKAAEVVAPPTTPTTPATPVVPPVEKKPSLLTEALAKLAAGNAPATKPVVPVVPAVTTPTAKPAATTALAQSLAKLKIAGTAQSQTTQTKVIHAAKAEAAAKQAAEAKSLTASQTVVPDEIWQLDPAIHRIDGLQAEALSATLGRIHQSLLNDQPDLPVLLEAVNKNLRQYEELSYLLTPVQLGLFFDGLLKVTNTVIKTTAPKKNSAQLHQQVAKEGGFDIGAM